MLFDVQFHERGGWQVVAVVGDVDLANLPRLRPTLDRLDGQAAALDLRGVDYFDPICTGVLVAVALRARRRGARLVLVGSVAVREMLEETRLDQVLELVDELGPPD